MFKDFFSETRVLSIMAVPLIAAGLVETSIGFVSTIFAAHLGHDALIATALVSSLFSTLMVFMWGLFSAISTLVAQYYAEKNYRSAAQVTRDSFVIGFLMGVPTIIIIWFVPNVLYNFAQWQAVLPSIKKCLYSFIPGIIPDFLSIVLIQFFLGLGETRMIMVFTILFTILNISANYILMFGKWGFPALGIAGIGWGASLSMIISVLFLMIYLVVSLSHRKYLPEFFSGKLFSYIKELCVLGVPIGLMYCIELGFFMVIAFLIGSVDTKALAAHQIVMQYFILLASVVFCIEKVTSVRINHVLVEGNSKKVRVVGYSSMFLCGLFMFFVGLAYWMFSLNIIAIDLDVTAVENRTIIAMAQQFLIIAAIFQLIEAICIATFGALRGLKDTRYTMYVSLITFWGIATPLSYCFVFLLHWDISWVWWSMVIAAIFEAILLIWRYQVQIKRLSFSV